MPTKMTKRTALDFKLAVVGILSQQAKKMGLILVGIKEHIHGDQRSLILDVEVATEESLRARREDEIVTDFCVFATNPDNTIDQIIKRVCGIHKITKENLQILLKKRKLSLLK